jgi:hypothetical protein
MANVPLRVRFGKIEIPVESVKVRGEIRDHEHEYPHVPGGDPEKLGLRLYRIEIGAAFHRSFTKWPNLWPARLNELARLFEAQTTDDLVIPWIGTFRAYCKTWDREFVSKTISGERVSFSFVQDEAEAFKFLNVVESSTDAIPQQVANIDKILEEINADDDAIGLFDQIKAAANSVLAFADQAEAVGGLLEAKILGLVALCQEADERLELLNDSETHELLAALHELWHSANKLNENIQRKLGKLVPFRVPATMSVQEISQLVYKSPDRGIEILQLNPIDDAFAVPAGTVVRLYELVD